MTDRAPEWRVEPGLLDYAEAVGAMEARAEAIRAGTATELIWLVEHAPVYTAGTSAQPDELIDPGRFPVHTTGRGGKYTYHGPGQRTVYVMLDLDARGRDIRRFVAALEEWVIAALASHAIEARIVPGKIGVWTDTPAGAAKIGAIGIRVRRWVSYHGVAINVAPDLTHFSGIVPCGLSDPVTSIADLGHPAEMSAFDASLRQQFPAMLSRLTGP